MSEHRATIAWSLGSTDFTYETYPRDHVWKFAGGVEVQASAAPDYQGDPDRVDPEQAFVASLASCHMLTFLAIAARKRLIVQRYEDAAVGHMEKNADGKMAITRVVLHPRVEFGGSQAPSTEDVERMHEKAHANCFIANSVRAEVTVEQG